MSEGEAQPRIRAKVTNDVVDYLHNDLANAAHFLRNRIDKALENKERSEGIFLDMMAAVTMLAFSLEGYVNFLGERIVRDMDQRLSLVEKVKEIRKALGIEIDWNKRPYDTARELIRLRNMLAHPKAHKAEPREYEAIGTDSELRQMLRDHKPEYEKMLTPEFVNVAYEDVDAIWNDLRETAQIEAHETWSGGSQGIEFLEHVEPDGRTG